uniref:Conserved oligomeric Golgi complex subunit 3 n=1 Tax=Rhabditophanes sp. KR3021 TaxID=114890 RepID=A0AC35TIQ6_9BILA
MDKFLSNSRDVGKQLEERCNGLYDNLGFEEANDPVPSTSSIDAALRLNVLRASRHLEAEACKVADNLFCELDNLGGMNDLLNVLDVVDNVEQKKVELKVIFEDLKHNYRCVTDKTSSLHHACESMLSQQTHLAAGSEEIKTNLHYYQQVQWVMKKLQTPKLPVTGSLFTQILTTIKDCMSYLEAHSDYKESKVYYEKYEQCLSKSFTILKMSTFADFEKAKENVLDKRNEHTGGDESKYTEEEVFTLMYGVFGVKAFQVKNAFSIANKFFSNNQEYQNMIVDCLKEYTRIRWELISPIITATIDDMLKEHGSSSCLFLKKGCAFLLNICDDEFRLMKEFFFLPKVENKPTLVRSSSRSSVNSLSSTRSKVLQRATPIVEKPVQQDAYMKDISESFDDFTAFVCRILYDAFRPNVVHIKHLELLVQLFKILKSEFIQGKCVNIIQMLPESETWIHSRSGFIKVMNELCGDLVERIIHRTHSFAIEDIIGYNPCPGDLLYPEKLKLVSEIDETQVNENKILHALWYPTVKRTLLSLSRIHQVLDADIFQSLMVELIVSCCESLQLASEKIKQSTPIAGSVLPRFVDGELFLIKYLLILREQTIPYRAQAMMTKNTNVNEENAPKSPISNVDYSFDLSKYKEYASQLFDAEHRAKMFEFSSENPLLNALLSPPIQITESIQDSKKVIDAYIKKSCLQFIANVSIFLIGQMKQTREIILEWNSKPADEVSKVDWGKNDRLAPKILNDVTSVIYKRLLNEWPILNTQIKLYLKSKETEDDLTEHIKDVLLNEFGIIEIFVTKNFTNEQKAIITLPSCDEIKVALNN